MSKFLRAEGGAAAIEFSLMVPLLLMLFGGFMEFGRYFYQSAALQDVVQQATRVVIVRSPESPTNPIMGDPKPVIVTLMSERLANLARCAPTVNQTSLKRGDNLTVEVACPYDFLMPGVNSLVRMTIRGRASMVVTS